MAFIICYVTTYLLIALEQKHGPEEIPWKGIINWFGDPPFFWVSAYILGKIHSFVKRHNLCSFQKAKLFLIKT